MFSLEKYEQRRRSQRKIMNKIKLSWFIVIVVLSLFIPKTASNSVPESVYMRDSLEKWSEYFYNKYNMYNLRNPWTGLKITKNNVINVMEAIGIHESGNNPNAIISEPSVNGNSYGRFCVLSPTAKATGKWSGEDPKELLNIDKNTEVAVCYFSDWLVKYDGDILAAIAAYNGGKCRIRKDGKYKNQKYVSKIYKIYRQRNSEQKKYSK